MEGIEQGEPEALVARRCVARAAGISGVLGIALNGPSSSVMEVPFRRYRREQFLLPALR